MEIKKPFEKFKDQGSFLKVTSSRYIEGAQKAALNRKGNQLFNEGKIEDARRIFLTTRYSDGISRVGDFYKFQSRFIEALQMYWVAPDHKKSEPIIEQLAGFIQSIIQEEQVENDY